MKIIRYNSNFIVFLHLNTPVLIFIYEPYHYFLNKRRIITLIRPLGGALSHSSLYKTRKTSRFIDSVFKSLVEPYNVLTKYQSSTLASYKSKILLQETILGLADRCTWVCSSVYLVLSYFLKHKRSFYVYPCYRNKSLLIYSDLFYFLIIFIFVFQIVSNIIKRYLPVVPRPIGFDRWVMDDYKHSWVSFTGVEAVDSKLVIDVARANLPCSVPYYCYIYILSKSDHNIVLCDVFLEDRAYLGHNIMGGLSFLIDVHLIKMLKELNLEPEQVDVSFRFYIAVLEDPFKYNLSVERIENNYYPDNKIYTYMYMSGLEAADSMYLYKEMRVYEDSELVSGTIEIHSGELQDGNVVTPNVIKHWKLFFRCHILTSSTLAKLIADTIKDEGYTLEDVFVVLTLKKGGLSDDDDDHDDGGGNAKYIVTRARWSLSSNGTFTRYYHTQTISNVSHNRMYSSLASPSSSEDIIKTKSKWFNTLFLTAHEISDVKIFNQEFYSLDPYARYSVLCRICYSNNLYKMVSFQYTLNDKGPDTRKAALLEYIIWISYHVSECVAKHGFEAYEITGLQFDVFCIDFTTKSHKKIFSAKTHCLYLDTTKKNCLIT